jgi:hypothetical protein
MAFVISVQLFFGMARSIDANWLRSLIAVFILETAAVHHSIPGDRM